MYRPVKHGCQYNSPVAHRQTAIRQIVKLKSLPAAGAKDVSGNGRNAIARLGKRTAQVLQSARTTLDVFEAVAQHQPIGVTDLARLLGLTKPTAQRCLVTLCDAGWIRVQENSAAKWVITAKSFSLGRHALSSGQLRDAVLPLMVKLQELTHESNYLMIADGRSVVGIERIEGTRPVRSFIPIGQPVALHAASSGKIFLAYCTPEALDAYIAGGLPKVAANTIQDPEKLRRQLSRIRKQGWAVSIDEFAEGTSAIAAAILDGGQRPVASIVLALPTNRFAKRLRAKYAALVVDAAKKAHQRVFGAS
jgi:DNA-binding IclR family transcriptional regulator